MTAERFRGRAFHRFRGEILLMRGGADLTSAEEAFKAAIKIAKGQGARGYALLALAKLYQSRGRAIDARGVLAPALEGFAPTPEMPQIAEAQALFCGLSRATQP